MAVNAVDSGATSAADAQRKYLGCDLDEAFRSHAMVFAADDARTKRQVVDWKTGRAETTDPLQLAIYRQAWAEVCEVPPDRVDAVFYLVAADSVVRPEQLPGRAEIAELIAGPEADETSAGLV